MVLVDKPGGDFYKEKRPTNNIYYDWDIVHEEGREEIVHWRDKRIRVQGARKAYHEFLVHSFDFDTLRSFFQNINFMVVIQMILAVIAVYLFQRFDISFDVHVGLFVSPIVFPLAFSINTDFQRREKVLEDLAVFKSSGMVWYFCMREWKSAAELDVDWITAVHGKLKSLLFHLREYLLTCKPERRKKILRAMYEDFSDTNQLIERVRGSKLPANTAIISRSIHLLNMMCLSLERLRVIREYRSPRSIRSFNKVLIMFLPIILSPYFVYLGIKSKNVWEPYYLAVLVAFVFSALQGVQDKLDDPFDGMSEDDIDLDTIDEWTFSSLEHTMKRTFDIGRFKVTVDPKEAVKTPIAQRNVHSEVLKRKSTYKNPLLRSNTREAAISKDNIDIEKFKPLLEGLKGNTRITRKSLYIKPTSIEDDRSSTGTLYLETIHEPIIVSDVNNFKAQLERKVAFVDDPIVCSPSKCINNMTYQRQTQNESMASPYTLTRDQSAERFPNIVHVGYPHIPNELRSECDHNIPDLSGHNQHENGVGAILELSNVQINNTGTPVGSTVNQFCVSQPNRLKYSPVNICDDIEGGSKISSSCIGDNNDKSLLIEHEESNSSDELSEGLNIASISILNGANERRNISLESSDSNTIRAQNFFKNGTTSYSPITSVTDNQDNESEKETSTSI